MQGLLSGLKPIPFKTEAMCKRMARLAAAGAMIWKSRDGLRDADTKAKAALRIEGEIKSMDLGLKDRLIVVTGGGAGIGAGISRACLAEGAHVVVLGRRSENVLVFMEEMQSAKAQC